MSAFVPRVPLCLFQFCVFLGLDFSPATHNPDNDPTQLLWAQEQHMDKREDHVAAKEANSVREVYLEMMISCAHMIMRCELKNSIIKNIFIQLQTKHSVEVDSRIYVVYEDVLRSFVHRGYQYGYLAQS